MRNYLLIFALIGLLASCSKDDDQPAPEVVIPADEKLLGSAGSIDGTSIVLEYNADKTIKELTFGGVVAVYFNYTEGLLSSFDLLAEGELTTYNFIYDANGKIDSFSVDDEVTDVTYNAAGNYYLYPEGEDGDEITLFLTPEEDVKKVVFYDGIEDETSTTTFIYEDSNKGPLYNSNSVIAPLIVGFPELYFITVYLTYKPIEVVGYPEGMLQLENVYDEQGFVKERIGFYGDIETFNYIQL